MAVETKQKETLSIRVTAEEKERFKKVAESKGWDLTTLVSHGLELIANENVVSITLTEDEIKKLKESSELFGQNFNSINGNARDAIEYYIETALGLKSQEK
jgi:antitoxin component of RelBE/YafQ-DinJ toxin-antitoxin module